MEIAVIGAGPAGLAAALESARRGAHVTLYERNAALGRKLLVTGSGRCNITNEAVSAQKYACADTAWMQALLAQFGVCDLVTLLRQNGVLLTQTSDGWYYPLSYSAQSVLDALCSALQRAGVCVRLSSLVKSIRLSAAGFEVGVENEASPACFERVIVAAGGKAYPTLGSTGELFPVLARLGLPVLPKRPALAPLLVDLAEWKKLQGMRLDVGAHLWLGKTCLAESAGNLIVTEWGLNGPAVMDLSYAVSAHPEAKLVLSLDVLHFIRAEFLAFLKENQHGDLPLQVFLGAFFVPKVTAFLLQQLRLPGTLPLREVEEATLQRLLQQLGDMRLGVKGVRGFEYCQVSAGGVPVTEVNPLTLEALRLKGLYLVGETLDVVGPCGGYNLHYAFASGALAGRAAGG